MMTFEHKHSIPRMRTVAEAVKELRHLDPKTAISAFYVKQICLQGIIPTVKAGRKILLNFDVLLEYLRNPTNEEIEQDMLSDLGFRRIT